MMRLATEELSDTSWWGTLWPILTSVVLSALVSAGVVVATVYLTRRGDRDRGLVAACSRTIAGLVTARMELRPRFTAEGTLANDLSNEAMLAGYTSAMAAATEAIALAKRRAPKLGGAMQAAFENLGRELQQAQVAEQDKAGGQRLEWFMRVAETVPRTWLEDERAFDTGIQSPLASVEAKLRQGMQAAPDWPPPFAARQAPERGRFLDRDEFRYLIHAEASTGSTSARTPQGVHKVPLVYLNAYSAAPGKGWEDLSEHTQPDEAFKFALTPPVARAVAQMLLAAAEEVEPGGG